MYGSYQVTRLPDVTEKVIFTIHPLYDCYKWVTKCLLYKENVWSYQVTRLPDITEEVIFTIHILYCCYKSVTKWLTSFIGKMYGSY